MVHSTRFWSTIRRRGWLIGLLAIAFSCAGVITAYSMTPIFRSEGKILVEEGDIPEDMLPTTVRGLVEERIELVRKRVFSDENISNMISRYSLYSNVDPELSAREKFRKFEDSSAVLVEEMVDGTISFTVSFDDTDPQKAKEVTDSLLTLFPDENMKDRTESASVAAGFFKEEAVRIAAEIEVFEEKIARYKEVNKGRLPDQLGLNMQLLDRAERELESVGSEIRALEQRRSLVAADIFRLNNLVGFGGEPPAPGSADRLRYLQAEYLRMLSIYSSQHPDLLRVKREIELLSPGASGLTKRYIAEQIRARELELADLRSRYSSDHPDIVSLEGSIAELKAALANAPDGVSGETVIRDPELNRLIAERDGVDKELAAQRGRRNELHRRISEYEKRLAGTPEIERELLELTRGYEQLKHKYDDVKLDQTQVELAVSVEERQGAGRFAVISWPRVSSSSVIPNRPAVIFLGLFFGMGLGLSLASILESVDKTIRDEQDVRDAWGGPAMAAIPEIRNRTDLRRRAVFLTAYLVTISSLILGAALTVVVAQA